MSEFWSWAGTLPWYAWVAIVAVAGGIATKITMMIISHRERMEAIRQGGAPDQRISDGGA